MSNRRELPTETRTIHARALHTLGEEAAIVMLGVARDLRSGVIPPEKFDMLNWCGTAHCMGGEVALRLGMRGRRKVKAWVDRVNRRDTEVGDLYTGVWNLFNGNNPSDTRLAADAIERYVYEGADNPWAA